MTQKPELLKERIARMASDAAAIRSASDERAAIRTVNLERDLERAIEVLVFYADEENHADGQVRRDYGEMAREILEEIQ